MIHQIILALVQGITEFLPVSSSGHLILVNAFFPIDAGLLFDIILHFATLLSVVVFYRREIWGLLSGSCRDISALAKHKSPGGDLKIVGFLALATLVTAIIGFSLKDIVELRVRSVGAVGVLLIINAGILSLSRFRGKLKLSNGELNIRTALLIGLVQGIAVLPGISRSGTTITASLLAGIDPKSCAKYSFLLSIPVILGAIILHLGDLAAINSSLILGVLVAATVAAITGYLCLMLLEKILKKAKFHYFAPYCLIVGIVAVIWSFLG